MVGPGGSIRVGTAVVAGVLAGTVLVGCGNDGGSADGEDRSAGKGSSGAREQGTEAVRSAYDRTAEQDTARVTLRVRTSADGTSMTATSKGTVDLEDGDSVMALSAQGRRIEQRVVDQVLYQKLPRSEAPDGKPWIRIDLRKVAEHRGVGDQSVNDPARAAAFAKAIDDKDVTREGTAEVGGVDTTRYRVAVDVTELPDGATLRRQVGPTLPMDVWLDDDGRIRRQQIDMTLKAPAEEGSTDRSSSSRSAKVRTVMEFSDFGTDVEAEEPPSGQVTDLTRKALEGSREQN
ncbi:hypothetical protein [Streptomyces prasinopilosus]|uniref:Lipoprotein n=1 Tax=Streptomyces prasinopilosus TaxID=67344 RepID=A0A1G6YF25_9ACTN|nr:hypothetical protein [Streptomyces prasinopilosus]SDD88922.1 hypothetical protein SAMN05216505_11325 [Streptomyces prasinopilosus]